MDIKTVTWGWYPPAYELRANGTIVRLFFHVKEQEQTIQRRDPETEEITEETIINYLCKVVELSDKKLITFIKDSPNALHTQKLIAQRKVEAYDYSNFVNEFTLGGLPMWLDKATRVGLKLRFDAELKAGKESTTLWHEGMSVTLPLIGENNAFDMLDALELYASECYDNTQQHIANISALESVEEIQAYNYMTGYPEKIQF